MRKTRERYCPRGSGKHCQGSWDERTRSWGWSRYGVVDGRPLAIQKAKAPKALVQQPQDTLLVPAVSFLSVMQQHTEVVEGIIKENLFWAKMSF